MATSDRERADQLCELARQFFLWLKTNPPGGLSGLKGLGFDAFRLFVGSYRKLEPILKGVPNYLYDELWDAPEERRRLKAVVGGAEYVLLITNPFLEGYKKDEDRWYTCNQVTPPAGKALDLSRGGALVVYEPHLDSIVANPDNLASFSHTTFAGLVNRVDLVWDDLAEAERLGFASRYRWIFNYETPRPEFEKNVSQITPLDSNEKIAPFRDYLYQYGTYTSRTRVAANGGKYYRKWQAKTPLRQNQRVFLPTKLNTDYLVECFHEPLLKKDESYILITVDGTRFVYHLLMSPASAGKPPRLSVTPVLKFDNTRRARTEPKVTPPIEAVIFHALDGGNSMPSPTKGVGKIELQTSSSGRKAYDYKAAVRWYFDGKHSDPGNDEAWFSIFVDTLFPDMIYAVDGTHKYAAASAYTFDELVKLGELPDVDGPILAKIEAMRAAARTTPKLRFVVKGSMYGADEDSRRQLIGVSNDYVYEWYPKTGLVTRMTLANWYEDNYTTKVATDVYENTRGMLPIITVVTWGGVIVMTGGILGGGPIANLMRTDLRKYFSRQAIKQLTKELIKKFRAQLIALLADGILHLFPDTKNAWFELLRGFVHGFGAGAIEHYVTTTDDRIEKQIKKLELEKRIVSELTGGLDKVYEVYKKLNAALSKLEAVMAAIKKIWTPQLAEAAGTALVTIGTDLAISIIVTAFVFAYVDYLAKEGLVEQAKRDAWARAQRDVLKLMIKETAADLAAYADAVRDDLTSGPPSSDIIKARNDKLAASIFAAVMKAPTQAPNAMAIFQDILKELGIQNIEQLLDLGFLELVTRGWDAMIRTHPDLLAKGAKILGEALGELIGTIFLERAIMPKAWRKGPITGVRPADKAIKKSIQGGTMTALWHFAKFPLDELRLLLKTVTDDIKNLGTDSPDVFERVKRNDTVYRDLLRLVMSHERELTASTTKLAQDTTLGARLLALKEKVENEVPPPITEVLDPKKLADPEWPRDALLFVLENWLRIGLNQLLRAFDELESDVKFAGKFRLATLLEIAGLSTSLDDKLAAQLAVKFAREFHSAVELVEQ